MVSKSDIPLLLAGHFDVITHCTSCVFCADTDQKQSVSYKSQLFLHLIKKKISNPIYSLMEHFESLNHNFGLPLVALSLLLFTDDNMSLIRIPKIRSCSDNIDDPCCSPVLLFHHCFRCLLVAGLLVALLFAAISLLGALTFYVYTHSSCDPVASHLISHHEQVTYDHRA